MSQVECGQSFELAPPKGLTISRALERSMVQGADGTWWELSVEWRKKSDFLPNPEFVEPQLSPPQHTLEARCNELEEALDHFIAAFGSFGRDGQPIDEITGIGQRALEVEVSELREPVREES